MSSTAPTSVKKPQQRSREELADDVSALQSEVANLKKQVDWFKRQVFGSKSEKRPVDHPQQLGLDAAFDAPSPARPVTETITYTRKKGPKVRPEDCVTDSGLRFDDSVPMKTITLPVLELEGLSKDDYELIDIKDSYKLAQRPASYTVLRYRSPVVKIKQTQKIVSGISLMTVLDNSIADVSLLVGLLVDKFLYHLPLYRQHQRIQNAGITLSRTTLTNLVKRTIALLEPIVDAQRLHILTSRVLAMDETPIKVGGSRKQRGKLHQGYYWPIYGEDDEVVFTYSDSRAHAMVEKLIRSQFDGTIISDGYAAYARYAQKNDRVTLAQCWTHTRRQFIEAEKSEPDAVAQIISMIAVLYKHEKSIKDKQLNSDKKRDYRLTHSKPVVDAIFQWVEDQLKRADLLPSDPFTQALKYLHTRSTELRVYLSDPDVPIDTNHLERVIRPIPMGRRNWLFCWSELGAKQVGVIQSLITTCRLHDVNPYDYLVDVLQRIQIHPDSQIIELTPRLWKTHFADDPMRSDLELDVNNGSE